MTEQLIPLLLSEATFAVEFRVSSSCPHLIITWVLVGEGCHVIDVVVTQDVECLPNTYFSFSLSWNGLLGEGFHTLFVPQRDWPRHKTSIGTTRWHFRRSMLVFLCLGSPQLSMSVAFSWAPSCDLLSLSISISTQQRRARDSGRVEQLLQVCKVEERRLAQQ